MMEENKVRERSSRLTKELVKRGLVEPLDMVVQLVEEAIFRELVADSSAPNVPEVTRLSGEQAEERMARESRKDNMQNHWWETREVNGRWVSNCEDCGLVQDIHEMTEAEIKASTLAMEGQCPGKPVAAAEN